jgi:hypothetical protein
MLFEIVAVGTEILVVQIVIRKINYEKPEAASAVLSS